MNEKQLKQINKNLHYSRNKPAKSALSSETISNAVTKNSGPMCKCGKPRVKIYFDFLGKYLYAAWCKECEDKHKQMDIETEKAEKREIINRAIKREIEPNYQTATLEDFSEQIRALLQQRDPKTGILIWGGTGTGKTHLAAAMVRKVLELGKSAKVIEFTDLIMNIKASYSNNHTEEAVFRPFIRCGFLVIEDIGTIKSGEKETNFVQDKLLTVIGKRINRELPTVITTNLSPETLQQAFGERIGSRLSTFLTFKLEGRDRRKGI